MHASHSTTLPSPHTKGPKPENISSSATLTTTATAGYQITPGFTSLYNSRVKNLSGVRFRDLLRDVAAVDPEIRIRFTSPHPKVSTVKSPTFQHVCTRIITHLYVWCICYVCHIGLSA